MEKRKLRKIPAWARGCDSLFRLHYRRDLFTSSSQDASAVSANPCPSLAYSASYLACSFTCWRRSNCSTHRGPDCLWNHRQRSVLLIERGFCFSVLSSLEQIILGSCAIWACCRGQHSCRIVTKGWLEVGYVRGQWPETIRHLDCTNNFSLYCI